MTGFRKAKPKVDLMSLLKANTQNSRKRTHEVEQSTASTSFVAKRPKNQPKDVPCAQSNAAPQFNLQSEMTKLGVEFDEEELSHLLQDTNNEKANPVQFPQRGDFEHVEYEGTDSFWTPLNPTQFKTEDVVDSRFTARSAKLVGDSQVPHTPDSSHLNPFREIENRIKEMHSSNKKHVKTHRLKKCRREAVVLNKMSVQQINAILRNRTIH